MTTIVIFYPCFRYFRFVNTMITLAQVLHQTCYIRLAISLNTVQHRPTMLDDVAINH